MWVLPLDSNNATLSLAGGKGLNLALLSQAGLPLPGGFIITTEAYTSFVTTNNLTDFIQTQVTNLATADPQAYQSTSQTIRKKFVQGIMPEAITQAILESYATMQNSASVNSTQKNLPVAVRSSATAEDLPDLSFAGQQDTYLNIIGKATLLKAVIDCWSSLWTARAIGYRTRNDIAHDDVALAVVVQNMIPSEASGVLFTANPLNGRRTEIVIDATFGLGEALVSGQVEPDHYVVSAKSGTILQKEIGTKAVVIHGQKGGGINTITMPDSQQQAIPDDVIGELAALGQQIAALYDFPQDIEWAWAAKKLWILQSRPITSLFPIPDGTGWQDSPAQMWFSFAAVQGMMEPMTPLGRDTIRVLFAGLGRPFGVKTTWQKQPLIDEAAERLWVNFTGLMQHPIGRRVLYGAIKFIDPGAASAISQLLDDARLAPEKGWFKWSTARKITRFLLPIILNFVRTMRNPDAKRQQITQIMDGQIKHYTERFASAKTLGDHITLFEAALTDGFGDTLPQILPVLAPGIASLQALNKLAATTPAQNALQITRGLPHNVTTEMDLSLWQTAQSIKANPEANSYFSTHSTDDLTKDYQTNRLPRAAQTAVSDFLKQYGMRGIGEIDIGRPRWRDAPTHIIQVIQSYMQINDPQMAPDAVFARGKREAAIAILELETAVRHHPIKKRLIRPLATRLRALSGLRESPKFHIIRLMGLAHEAFLQSGTHLVKQGVFTQKEDIFFLTLVELKQLAAGKKDNWQELITERRHLNAREQKRRQIPHIILSDGQAFYEGVAASADIGENQLIGSPVSPGVVEGCVRVVLDPISAQLQPGEILVCAGTDPAWTPLFLTAGGLITEVGGMMTHGSVVAREYGIPAVVGVYEATTRLQTGQMIRVDGSSGIIEILDQPL